MKELIQYLSSNEGAVVLSVVGALVIGLITLLLVEFLFYRRRIKSPVWQERERRHGLMAVSILLVVVLAISLSVIIRQVVRIGQVQHELEYAKLAVKFSNLAVEKSKDLVKELEAELYPYRIRAEAEFQAEWIRQFKLSELADKISKQHRRGKVDQKLIVQYLMILRQSPTPATIFTVPDELQGTYAVSTASKPGPKDIKYITLVMTFDPELKTPFAYALKGRR